MAMFASVALFFHSLYIFGGTIFHRNTVVLTTFSIIAAGLMFGWLDINPGIVSLGFGDKLGIAHNRIDPFVFGALTALCYWGSYRIYRRMQVINNKWTNL